MSKDDLAIVIVTKNEERNLPRLLASIAGNGVTAERVVVVDAHSTDRTAAIARDFGATVIFERPNLSAQRNAGAKRCGARWLMMLDADMELPFGIRG